MGPFEKNCLGRDLRAGREGVRGIRGRAGRLGWVWHLPALLKRSKEASMVRQMGAERALETAFPGSRVSQGRPGIPSGH